MKQGTNFILPVLFGGVDLDSIERIDFVFKPEKRNSSTRCVEFRYPSDRAVRREGFIDLHWTEAETWTFKAGEVVCMDTKIYINGSPYNPPTPIKKMIMNETLFDRGGA